MEKDPVRVTEGGGVMVRLTVLESVRVSAAEDESVSVGGGVRVAVTDTVRVTVEVVLASYVTRDSVH